MWIEDSRPEKYSRCTKCRKQDSRCGRCLRVFQSGIYLHYKIEQKTFETALRKLGTFQFDSFPDVLKFYSFKSIEVLTFKNIRRMETKFKMNIDLYKEDSDKIELVRRARVDDEERFPLTIRIVKDSYPDTIDCAIETFSVIFDEKKVPRPYKCSVVKSCSFEADTRWHLERHEKRCFKLSECNIDIQQKSYGGDLCELEEMIKLKILPIEAKEYVCPLLATWDIETMEQVTGDEVKDKGMTELAVHKLLSIAVGSNFSDSKCWRRRKSGNNEDIRMIKSLLKELYHLYDEKQKILPRYFTEAEEKVEEMILQKKGSMVND